MTRMTAVTLALLALAALPAHAQDRQTTFFREMDTNGDGFVDEEEFTLRRGEILYMLDSNHNLKLERNETKLSPEQFRRYAGADGTLDGGDFFNLPSARFSAFDKDGDRQISRAEFRTQIAEIRSGQETAEMR